MEMQRRWGHMLGFFGITGIQGLKGTGALEDASGQVMDVVEFGSTSMADGKRLEARKDGQRCCGIELGVLLQYNVFGVVHSRSRVLCAVASWQAAGAPLKACACSCPEP